MRVVIKLLETVRQYPEGLDVPCPPDILDKVDSDEASTVAPDAAAEALLVPVAPSFIPGDEVIFNPRAHPRYLIGASATVVRILPRNLVINLHETNGRFPGGEMRCPPELLDKVEQDGK